MLYDFSCKLCTSVVGDSKLNKRVSVTTPSAGKSFGRFKNSMIQELYTLFNSTVFNNNVKYSLSMYSQYTVMCFHLRACIFV